MSTSLSPPAGSAAASGRSLIRPLVGFILALVVAVVAWGIVQAVHPIFQVPKEFEAPSIGMKPEVYLANRRAQELVERRHAMVYAGLLGALLGGALALAGGSTARWYLTPLVAAPLGAVGGAIGGHLGSRVQEYTLEHIGQPELWHTVLAQAAVLVPLATALGLGLGLAARDKRAAGYFSGAGLAAGLVAAAAYPIAMSIFRPSSSTDHLLPVDRGSQLLWFVLVAGVIAGAVAVAGQGRKASDR